MARTSTQALTSLTRCVNKICLKQKDILQTQDYILESNGWDRNCDPVCFTISGPATGPGLDQFELLNGGTAANLLFSHVVYPIGLIDTDTALQMNTPLVFTPNTPVCVYLQPNDDVLNSILVNVSQIPSEITGAYTFVVTQNNTEVFSFIVPNTNVTVNPETYISLTLSEDCVLTGFYKAAPAVFG
jgi:hypothetical protein